MRRVYVLWAFRKLTSPTAMKLLMLFAILKESFSAISIPNVIANSPSLSNPLASYNFFDNAFFTTETTVRIFLISIIVLLVWLTADFVKKTPQPSYQSGF